MIAEEVISFRKSFWPHHFPIEVRFYQFGSLGSSRTLTAQRISSAQELHVFQEELTRRESTYEWSFIAYYEPMMPEYSLLAFYLPIVWLLQ